MFLRKTERTKVGIRLSQGKTTIITRLEKTQCKCQTRTPTYLASTLCMRTAISLALRLYIRNVALFLDRQKVRLS